MSEKVSPTDVEPTGTNTSQARMGKKGTKGKIFKVYTYGRRHNAQPHVMCSREIPPFLPVFPRFVSSQRLTARQTLPFKVHAILQVSPRKRAANTRGRETVALLKGLLFGPNGFAFTPTYTRRGRRLYRYYVSSRTSPRILRGALGAAMDLGAQSEGRRTTQPSSRARENYSSMPTPSFSAVHPGPKDRLQSNGCYCLQRISAVLARDRRMRAQPFTRMHSGNPRHFDLKRVARELTQLIGARGGPE